MEVRLSRGLFARQRRERERRERNKGYGINELLSNKSDTINILAPYKLQAELLPFVGDKRRIPKSCRECVKANREQEFKAEDEPELGIGNCLMLSNRNPDKPLTKRIYAEMFHYWDRGGQPKLFKKFVTAEDILNYPKFKDQMINIANSSNENERRIREVPVLENKNVLTLEKFVDAFGVTRLNAWIHRLYIRFGGWILSKIFNRIFDGVCYHKGTMKLLRIATETGLPIIYVPMFKSSLDPILFPWVLLTLGISPLPLVLEPRLTGQTPLMKNFASIFGGFGMQRLSNPRMGYTELSNLALFSYLRLSILNGNSLQFVSEPHRSRTGKPSPFLAGSDILSVVVDMYKRKELEDAFIVPICISYEKVPEQEMIEHAQIEPTKCGNVGSLSLWRLLQSSLGYVRVDLSQPVRLRDFKIRQPYSVPSPFNTTAEFPSDARSAWMLPAREFQFDDDAGSVASLNSLYGEEDPFYNVDENIDESDFSDSLAQHILYDAQKAGAFMSTNMLSFLLLKKFREGITLDGLIEEMKHLREEIYYRKRDVGFTGDMSIAVQRAIDLLGKSVILMSRNKDDQIFVKPVGTTKCWLVLGYYSNPLVQLYIKEACVSTAIFSIVGLSYKAMINTSFSLATSEDRLVHNSLEVAQLLKGEFILNPPCESTDTVIRQTIRDMNDFNYIQIHKKKEYRCPQNLDDSDDDDYDDIYDDGSLRAGIHARSDVAVRVEKIEFANDEKIWKTHSFLRNLVVPYLEFYKVGLTVLLGLVGTNTTEGEHQSVEDKEELELRQVILLEAKKLLGTKKSLLSEEVITVDTARNFLYHMASMDIIGSWSDGSSEGKRMYFLKEDYEKDPRKLQQCIACVMKYITY